MARDGCFSLLLLLSLPPLHRKSWVVVHVLAERQCAVDSSSSDAVAVATTAAAAVFFAAAALLLLLLGHRRRQLDGQPSGTFTGARVLSFFLEGMIWIAVAGALVTRPTAT